MAEWQNLKKYFESKFVDVSQIHVLLYVDVPLVVTFVSDNQWYIGYLYELDHNNLDAHWLIAETTQKDVMNLITGHVAVSDTMTKFEQKRYDFFVKDGKASLFEKTAIDFKIDPHFHIDQSIPNEIDLVKVESELKKHEK